MDLQSMRAPLTTLVDAAARAILEVYHGREADLAVTAKDDASPLTAADLASHGVLVAGLPDILDVPVVSEEGAKQADGDRFWLVDPLDGTKEFIQRNGDFTVNVALVDGGVPVLGMVQVPVTGIAYFGCGDGAWRRDGDWQRIRCAPATHTIKVVVSRSHRDRHVEGFLDSLRAAGHEAEEEPVGSSLKLCRVAEGTAHVYPRFGPTMPWDTAAAHAVVAGAGGTVTTLRGDELTYDHVGRPNPGFIAGGPDVPWHEHAPPGCRAGPAT